MIHQIHLTDGTNPENLRIDLINKVTAGDKLNITLDELSFTVTRSLLAIINTVAAVKQCQLKYHTQSDYQDPPLDASYTHEPNITTKHK